MAAMVVTTCAIECAQCRENPLWGLSKKSKVHILWYLQVGVCVCSVQICMEFEGKGKDFEIM